MNKCPVCDTMPLKAESGQYYCFCFKSEKGLSDSEAQNIWNKMVNTMRKKL